MTRSAGVMVAAALVGLAGPAGSLHARQETESRVWGDTARIGAIDAATRRIRDEAGELQSTISRENVPGLPSPAAARIRYAMLRGRPARIVAQVPVQDGRYSVEFYLMGGTLLLASETFEWEASRAPSGAWRNPAGNAAWERHTWFLGGAVVAARTTGRDGPPPGEDGERLTALACTLIALVPG